MMRNHDWDDEPMEDISRLRRAFLATKRDELLAPARVIADITTRLSLESETVDESVKFHEDMLKIHAACRSLLSLIDDILSPKRIDEASSASSLEELQSGLRHEMLNDLNTLILCSELWIEEAADHFLDSFLPDLVLIKDNAYRSVRLIDEILDSWAIDDSLELPTEDVEQLVKLAHKELEGSSCPPGQILIADDIKTNRDFLQRNLERLGHSVQIAKSGTEVLEKVKRHRFDLLLLDIKMPGMNGIDVLTMLKSDPAFQDVPVIMISALNDIEIVARCIKLGAEDYLPKPFNSVLLRARIEACLEKRRLYLAIKREQEQSHQLLEVILPPSIIRDLKSDGHVKPRRYDDVAVLFADIVGFTEFCEHNSPETVMNSLGQLVESWEESAIRHGVEKIKTIGDAFMAATGLWNASPNPVADCINCGLEMIEATEHLAAPWTLRVGIQIGPVVAGVMGKRKYLFDLWGDTVNTAARMESHGIPGSITMSQDAWSKVSGFSEGTPLGLVEIKGKGPMEMIRFDRYRDPQSARSQVRQSVK